MGSLYEFKIILVGESGVGKTSLILRFTENKFYENPESTLKIDIKDVFLKINGEDCLIRLHDTAGQETFFSLGISFFREADGVILVYDETNVESYNKISNWMEYVKKHCGEEIIMILAGNKTDDEDKKKVIDSRVKVFADSENLEVIKTSAKTDANVKEVFLNLIKMIVLAKGIAADGTDPVIEILEPDVFLLTAIDESKKTSKKERRSRFIAQHSPALDKIRISRPQQDNTKETQTDEPNQGCFC